MVHLELLYKPATAQGKQNAGRLVVVSNRVPMPAASSPAAGGLAVALESAFEGRGGLWFGWSGKTCDEPDPRPQIHYHGRTAYALRDLSPRDLDEFYHGFANRALWPICHYRLDLASLSRRDADGYFRVNEQFAGSLAELLRRDDIIWVHDYHFIPLASFLRRIGCINRIGFFLHIPWPAPDVARALPGLNRILRSFSAYDVVGFQTPADATNFKDCLAQVGAETTISSDGACRAFGRGFEVDAFPIGIDTAAFGRTARIAETNSGVARMRESLGGRPLIIGVDRLDYSKGIPERIEAFSTFLEHSPEAARLRPTLLQITPKSRSEVPEYARMHGDIAGQVGTVTGKWGDIDWTPIRYVNKVMSRSMLAGLYRLARVGLVTPLRDGMNLVAKEYVAAQDPENPGVLVLSQFAGAAQELEAAIIVNPYDIEATAAAIGQASAMPLDERKARWRAMMAVLRANTIDNWTARFLAVLATGSDSIGSADAVTPPSIVPEPSQADADHEEWPAPSGISACTRH
jgi:trehalose 6-phosphate synthase